MALTTCPDCNGKLSTKASKCPHCGYVAGRNAQVASESQFCAFHPAKPATAQCVSCGKHLCSLCRFRSQTRGLCADCFAKWQGHAQVKRKGKAPLRQKNRSNPAIVCALLVAIGGVAYLIYSGFQQVQTEFNRAPSNAPYQSTPSRSYPEPGGSERAQSERADYKDGHNKGWGAAIGAIASIREDGRDRVKRGIQIIRSDIRSSRCKKSAAWKRGYLDGLDDTLRAAGISW